MSPAGERDPFPRMRAVLPIAVAALLACWGVDPARAANPDKLWEIVHDACVPDQEQHQDPKPCVAVDTAEGASKGWAVLKDNAPSKPTGFLLIPTARVTGIEDPRILAPDAPNYFALAWRARGNLERLTHPGLPRDSIGLAINSQFGRTQNQLHIHIDCLRADVRDALRRHEGAIGEGWSPLGVALSGHPYRVRRIDGDDLGTVNPFDLLADEVVGAKAAMGSHTLVMTGAVFADGKVGFYLLDDHADLAAGDGGSGEELLDPACALAKR